MKGKPKWMDADDWAMSRFEMTKENIIAGGDMVESQEIKVPLQKVSCNSPFCGKEFFEFGDIEALGYCPHCAAKIDPQNNGKTIYMKLKLNTRTGRVEQQGYSVD